MFVHRWFTTKRHIHGRFGLLSLYRVLKSFYQIMSAPQYLSPSQVGKLKSASRPVKEPLGWNYEVGTVLINADLPQHAMAVAGLEFASERRGGGVRT